LLDEGDPVFAKGKYVEGCENILSQFGYVARDSIRVQFKKLMEELGANAGGGRKRMALISKLKEKAEELWGETLGLRDSPSATPAKSPHE
jgi:hypothetical protein